MSDIFWNGTSISQERNEGYKTSEDEIYKRLISKGLDITREDFSPSTIQNLSQNGIGLLYETDDFNKAKGNLLINNRLPSNYSKCNGFNIGFSYWETSKMPSEWVDRMNEMDEIWTTSLWAKNVFIESGVKVPVFDFKLGVDDKLFFPQLRQRRNRPFTFLSIGSPSSRKNSQLTVDAFVKLFGKDDNYKLIYKSFDAPDARLYNERGEPSSISNHPTIEIIDQDVPIEELSRIYDMADCVVYPTSGEGWGMLPFQGIAKGIPTICTNATACTEYASMSVPLDFKWGTKKMSGIYNDCGEWAEPNFDDLCDKMLYVVNNYDEVAKKTYDNAASNFKKMTWDYAAEGYYNRLCQILKK